MKGCAGNMDLVGRLRTVTLHEVAFRIAEGGRFARERVPVPHLMTVADGNLQAHLVGGEMHDILADLLAFIGQCAEAGGVQKPQPLAFLLDGYAPHQGGIVSGGRRLTPELNNPAHVELDSDHNPPPFGQAHEAVAGPTLPGLVQPRIIEPG